MENDFALTDSAAARINELKAQDVKSGLRFRVAVKGGGCSGFSYDFSLDEATPATEDKVFAKNGAEVVIDETSLGIVRGSVLDYTEDLAHAGFSITNPKATAKCGCGNSFAVSL